MRLVTYRERDGDGRDRVGVVEGDRVHDLATLGVETRDLLSFIRDGASVLHEIAPGDAAGVALADVQLRPPIPHPPRNVVCVGLNYAEHVAESQSAAGAGAPQHPVFFTKPPQTVIGPDDEIPWHDTVTRAVDWEVELAVVIGREGRDISEGEALDYVFGYTVANDITARDLQARHQQWYKGKGLDGYCPLGPMVVTAGEIGDPQALDLSLRVNGVEKQRSNTRNMIFGVAKLIAAWSAGMTLVPGDILLTGTPSGIGATRQPPEFLRPGDVVEAEVDRIGVLRNTVGGR